MAQPILAIAQYENPPQVYRLNFADPTGIGAKIGGTLAASPAFSGTGTVNYHTNFVLRHGRKIYAYQNLKIFVYDEENPSDDWQLLYTFPQNFFGGSQLFSGLYKMVLDDDPHLVGIGGASAITSIQHFSWNLRTNTLRSDGVVINAGVLDNQGFHGAVVWKQFLIYMDSQHSNSDARKFDFVNNSVTIINSTTLVDTNYDACTFSPWQGKLYMFHGQNAANVGLWEFDEDLNQFDFVHDIGFLRTTASFSTVRSAMWPHNGFLYLIAPTSNGMGGDGFTFWKFSQGTTISQQDITSSLPAGLQMIPTGSAEPVNWNGLQRWTAVVDQEAAPGTPQVTLYLSETGSAIQSTLTAYSWADPVLTAVDSGQASNFTLAQEVDGGGDRFWTPNDIVPEVTKVQATGTTVRVTFILHGGGVQSLGIWWAFNQDLPITRGTLTNPSSGTITGGGNDILSGITADGVTEYSVEWRAQFDGVTDLDDVNFMIKPD
jgi:hypothetical protein